MIESLFEWMIWFVFDGPMDIMLLGLIVTLLVTSTIKEIRFQISGDESFWYGSFYTQASAMATAVFTIAPSCFVERRFDGCADG